GEDAVSQALSMAPDVVLMDLHMPVCDGVEATRRLAAARPGIPVVVLTSYDDDDSVFAALRAGARGFLPKDARAPDNARAVTDVCAGAAQLDPSIQRRLVDAIARGDDPGGPARTRAAGGHAASGTRRPAGPAGPPPGGLTRREAEVLTEIAAGLSNAEIAAKLVVSDTTGKTHVNHPLAQTRIPGPAHLGAHTLPLRPARSA